MYRPRRLKPPPRVSRAGLAAVAGLGLLAWLGWAGTGPVPDPGTYPRSLTQRIHTLSLRDARLLADLTPRILDDRLEPLFADYHARIAGFAAWAYQWRTAYSLMRQGIVELAGWPVTDTTERRGLSGRWDEFIAAKFEELVLHPAGGAAALRRTRDLWLDDLQYRLDGILTDTLQTASLLHGRPATGPAETGLAEPPLPDPLPAMRGALQSVSDPVKLRAARPLLARLVIRPPVAAVVTAAGDGLAATFGGLGDYAMMGTLSGIAATVGTFLGLDYLLSRADAAINQDALEQELHRLLDAERRRLRQTWTAAARTAIDRRLAIVQAELEQAELEQAAVNGPGAGARPPAP
jgi:hypothetical protein